MMADVMKTEYKNTGSLSGKNHQQYVDAAAFIKKQNYTKDNIEDEDKMRRMEERVQTMVSNPNDQLKVMQMTSQILGADKTYELRRREGRTRIGQPPKRKEEKPTNNSPEGSGEDKSPTPPPKGPGGGQGPTSKPKSSGGGQGPTPKPKSSGGDKSSTPKPKSSGGGQGPIFTPKNRGQDSKNTNSPSIDDLEEIPPPLE